MKIHELMQKFHKIQMNAKNTGEMLRREMMMLKLIEARSTRAEGVTISALSDHLEISRSAVSQMINALEDKGYVLRQTTKSDRRLVYVKLTENGRQCLERQLRIFLEGIAQVFDKMGERDTEELLRLMQKLYAIISENAGNPE